MKNCILIVLFILPLTMVGQSSKKVELIYQGKNTLILNDGIKYDVVLERPYYYVNDPDIKQSKVIKKETVHLSRVIIIEKKGQHKRLVEWVGKDNIFYESANMSLQRLKRDYLYDESKTRLSVN